MQRIFKFRAWDTVNRRMIHSPMAICHDSWVLFTAEIEGMDCNAAIHPIQQYTLMQFTGLYDRKGVEIFEGDIVKADWHWDTPHMIALPHDYYDIVEYALEAASLEILGNIYENPELLKSGVSL